MRWNTRWRRAAAAAVLRAGISSTSWAMPCACLRRSLTVSRRDWARMSSRLPKPATSRAPATTATIVIVSRRVIPGSSQPVPHTPHSDQRQGIAEFLAQLAHVDVDRPLIAVPPGPPHAVEDLLAAERQAHVL